MSGDTTLSALDILMIERECLRLVHEFNHRADNRDTEGVLSLYTEDCHYSMSGKAIEGIDTFRAALMAGDPTRGMVHMSSDVIIDVHSSTSASGRGRVLIAEIFGTERAPIRFASFEDEYLRTGSGWRINRRVLTHMLTPVEARA